MANLQKQAGAPPQEEGDTYSVSDRIEDVNDPSVPVLIDMLAIDNAAQLNPEERLEFLKALCVSLKLNYLTKPFAFIPQKVKQGEAPRWTLYATRDCTDQLRASRNVTLKITERETIGDVFLVTAQATLTNGRTDEAIGAVALTKREYNTKAIIHLDGEDLANAYMKAETKAKRRVTLSICGLGIVDESELETMRAESFHTPAELAATAPVAAKHEVSGLKITETAAPAAAPVATAAPAAATVAAPAAQPAAAAQPKFTPPADDPADDQLDLTQRVEAAPAAAAPAPAKPAPAPARKAPKSWWDFASDASWKGFIIAPEDSAAFAGRELGSLKPSEHGALRRSLPPGTDSELKNACAGSVIAELENRIATNAAKLQGANFEDFIGWAMAGHYIPEVETKDLSPDEALRLSPALTEFIKQA